MTIVAAHGLGIGAVINAVIMVADSRITRNSPDSGKFVSRTDIGQKLIRITPNIVVGIAGDFRAIQLITALSKRLQRAQFSQPLFTNRSDVIMSIVGRELKEKWVYDDTSLLFSMEDLQDGTHKIYLMEFPDFIHKRLGPGLHVIGSDRATQQRFIDAVQTQTDFIKPKSLQEHVIPLWSAMGEVCGPEIGGSSGAYILVKGQCIPLNHAMSPDGGEHWIANVLEGNGTIRRQVNGKTIEGTTKDYSKVDSALSKPGGGA